MKKKPTKKTAKAKAKPKAKAPTKAPSKTNGKSVKPKSNHWRPTVHREGITVPITFTIPQTMLAKIDEMARSEHKSRSVIIVDMLRDAPPLAELIK